jgi:hypothetical protein
MIPRSIQFTCSRERAYVPNGAMKRTTGAAQSHVCTW